MKKDISSAGDGIKTSNASWSFSGDTYKNFDDHVSKSVPLYHEGQHLIALLSDYFIKNNSVCYDIGCSTGEVFSKLISRTNKENVRFIGIDPVKEMIDTAKKKHNNFKNVEFINANIEDVDLLKSDLVVSYFTLQFIQPKYRQIVANKIYESLNWGGALFLFEKVRAPDARFQDLMTGVYDDYKLEQGYLPLDIFTKTRSLKGILEPFSTQGNIDLMKRAGFVDFVTISKYINFEGTLFIK